MSNTTRSITTFTYVALACWFFTGCATLNVKRYNKLSKTVLKQDYAGAINTIKNNAQLYKTRNEFLYNMDLGLLYHYIGVFDTSNIYLEKAFHVYDELFTKSVTKEAAAILTNDNTRPYQAKAYELVFLHQIKAFNYLAQNKLDEALVESRRLQLSFNEWHRKDKSNEKYTSDGLFHLISALTYDAIQEDDNAAISVFKAIQAFGENNQLLPEPIKQYAYNTLKSAGRDKDIKTLKLDSSYHNTDSFPAKTTEIILIGYAGKGPTLQETAWWGNYIMDGILTVHHTAPDGRMETLHLPAPGLPLSEQKKAAQGHRTRSGRTFHIKFSLPAIKTYKSLTDHFTVSLNDQSKRQKSVVVNDFDRSLNQYLSDNKKSIIAKTALRVVIRTIASQTTKSTLETSNPIANLAINLGLDAATSQLEKADTRNCFLMPQKIHMIRIPAEPGTHTLNVAAKTSAGQSLSTKTIHNIKVKKGSKVFVFYSSLK